MYPFILAEIKKDFLIPYSGGESSVVQILIIFGLLLVVLTVAAYFVLNYLKVLKFQKQCGEKGLTNVEIGFIGDFLTRFHSKQELELLQKKWVWDDFANRIAHHYESLKLSEEDLINEAKTFDSIREKLGFVHSIDDKNLISSRTLPINYPISATYVDPNTGNTHTFHTKIIQNNDFCIGIQFPEKTILEQITIKNKDKINLAFARDDDGEYHFKTQFIRAVNYPQLMWYFRHSEKLNKSAAQKSLKIPATIMFINNDNEENIKEYVASIHSLNSKECTFTIKEDPENLTKEQGFLINFQSDDTSFCWGGAITNQVHSPKQIYYRSQFKNVNPQESLELAQFLKNITKQKNNSSSKKKSLTNG